MSPAVAPARAGRARVGAGLLAGLLTAWASVGLVACGDGSPRRDLPDLLLVSIDTLRADRVSSYGSANPTTPSLDRLFAEGLRFEQAIAPSAHTAPSHMSLFTGLDPAAHGVHNVSNLDAPVPRVADSVPLLVERLRDAGYYTVAFTDRGNLLPEMGFDRGFELQDAQYEGLRKKVQRCARWLEREAPDQPLFLFFHTYQVHAPYLPSAAQRGRFTDPAYRGVFRERVDELARLSPQAAFARAGDFLSKPDELGPDDLAFLSGLYDEGVATADEHLADLWAAWRATRGMPTSLVVVTSDHGEALGEHGSLGHGRGLWGEHLAVPLLMRGPGVAPGNVTATVSTTGLGPTLLELLDLPALPGQVDSFANLVRGERDESGELLPAVSQVVGGTRASRLESARTGEQRLLRREASGQVQDILFDLVLDPGETRNAAPEPAGAASSDAAIAARELGAFLDARWRDSEARFQRHGAGAGTSLRDLGDAGAERARELEGLGYLGDDSSSADAPR